MNPHLWVMSPANILIALSRKTDEGSRTLNKYQLLHQLRSKGEKDISYGLNKIYLANLRNLKADIRIRTVNLLVTNQLHYHCAISAKSR